MSLALLTRGTIGCHHRILQDLDPRFICLVIISYLLNTLVTLKVVLDWHVLHALENIPDHISPEIEVRLSINRLGMRKHHPLADVVRLTSRLLPQREKLSPMIFVNYYQQKLRLLAGSLVEGDFASFGIFEVCTKDKACTCRPYVGTADIFEAVDPHSTDSLT